MASVGVQISAFVVALMGVCAAIAATLLPNWKVNTDTGGNIITAVIQMQGLWMDCTWYSTGMFSCTVKYSILSLPFYIQTVRTAMVLSCILSTLGICISMAGMKCTKLGGDRHTKNNIAFAGGTCFLLAGTFGMISVSWYMKEIISSFLDPSIPESGKHEPGGAVYVGFISAGLHFLAGTVFCASCSRRQRDRMESRPKEPKPAAEQSQNNNAGYNLQDYV
ncbi:PREDICTED: claudin-20 [Nanorana parkeri]|uniref:claudin-20 n=1 Tax=Nanorana parkeri TaxID=125878 RepID=UPI0008542013|nr:PREDICTED: claudin-20 [Nanorana parkeri]